MARLNRNKSRNFSSAAEPRQIQAPPSNKIHWLVWVNLLLTLGIYAFILKEFYHVF